MAQALHLIRCDPSCNMARFYRMQIAPDLFGGVVLIRHWGRIGTSGQERRQWWPVSSMAETALQDWAAKKLRKGYRAVPDQRCEADRAS